MRNRRSEGRGTISTKSFPEYNPDYARRIGVKSAERKRVLVALVCQSRNNWNAVIVLAEDGKPIDLEELTQVRNYFFWDKDTVQVYPQGLPSEVGLWEYIGTIPKPTDAINTTLLTIKGVSEIEGSRLTLKQEGLGLAANQSTGIMDKNRQPNANYFQVARSILAIALGNLIHMGIKAKVWKDEVEAFDLFVNTANKTLSDLDKQNEEQSKAKQSGLNGKVYSSNPKF